MINTSSSSKTTLITGATSGIGRATAFEIAKQGHILILPCRNMEKGELLKAEIIADSGNEKVHLFECDLSSQQSIRTAAKEILSKFDTIDILINNAGIHSPKLELTEDNIEKTFAVNHLAYFLLTGLLLEAVNNSKNGRIINVASRSHKEIKLNASTLPYPKYYSRYIAYKRSKLANVMYTIDLAERLRDANVTVNSMHPGLVYTAIGMESPSIFRKIADQYKKRFARSPEKGAETVVYLATSDEVEGVTGKYFIDKQEAAMSRYVSDEDVRKELWELCEELTGFNY